MRILLSRVVPFLFAALLAAPAALHAQSVADLSPGTRVRVVDPGTGRIVGTITEVRGDSLIVLSGKGERAQLVALSVPSLRSLQVSRGRPSRLVSGLQGAAIGAVSGSVGGVAGFAVGNLVYGDQCDGSEDDLLCFSTGQGILLGVMIGVIYGGTSGAALGFLFPQERWRSVALRNAPALTVDRRGDGIQLGLSLQVP